MILKRTAFYLANTNGSLGGLILGVIVRHRATGVEFTERSTLGYM